MTRKPSPFQMMNTGVSASEWLKKENPARFYPCGVSW
jgi:hypothetical protein